MAIRSRDVVGVVGLRVGTIGVSFAANILVTRLLIDQFGMSGFAAISLIMTFPALLTFADLGVGASVVNAASDMDRDSGSWRPAIAASVRILTASSLVIVLTAIVLYASGGWTWVLGPAVSAAEAVDVGATLMLALVGVGVLASASTRVLQGWRYNITIAGLQATVPALTLGLTFSLIAMGAPSGLFGAVTAAATLVAAGLMWVPVRRRLNYSLLLRALKWSRDKSTSREVIHLALSSLVVSIGVAASFQLGRVWLSHSSMVNELAQYSLVAPLFVASISVMNQLAQTLWPAYRGELQSGTASVAGFVRDVGIVVSLAIIGATVFWFAVPIVLSLSAGDPSAASPSLIASFSALIVVQSLLLPAGMVLTDVRGFAVQRNVVVAMTAANLILMAVLTPTLGAVGVVLASAISIGLVQAPPTYIAAFRRIRNQHGAA